MIPYVFFICSHIHCFAAAYGVFTSIHKYFTSGSHIFLSNLGPLMYSSLAEMFVFLIFIINFLNYTDIYLCTIVMPIKCLSDSDRYFIWQPYHLHITFLKDILPAITFSLSACLYACMYVCMQGNACLYDAFIYACIHVCVPAMLLYVCIMMADMQDTVKVKVKLHTYIALLEVQWCTYLQIALQLPPWLGYSTQPWCEEFRKQPTYPCRVVLELSAP